MAVVVLGACPAFAAEWNQWGGSPSRNNVPDAENLAVEWAPGEFDPDTGAWDPTTSKNVAWAAALGSQSYGNPVVADGKIYCPDQDGQTTVLSATEPYDVLATNKLADGCMASPAVYDGALYLRTKTHLYKLVAGQ
jgi:outer membrane protein assembly factor BamB